MTTAPRAAVAASAAASPRRASASDLTGGFTGAVLSIPMSIGYGVLALASLGETVVPIAILAGLVSAIVAPVAGALLGGRSVATYGPRSVPTFLFAAVVAQHIARGPAASAVAGQTDRTLAVVFLVVMLAGLFQALFGALGVGAVIKYIPWPVMAGFQNAVAALIFLSQVDTLLGFTRHVPLLEIPRRLDAVQPLTLAVGVVTYVLIRHAGKLTTRVPAVLIGLAGGTALYYGLWLAGQARALGPTLGHVPVAVPTPRHVTAFVDVLSDRRLWPLLGEIGGGAFGLAIVAALDALLCARTVDGVTGQRSSTTTELVRLGLANMVVACFGGIPAGVNLSVTLASYRSGGRTIVAPVVTGLGVLVLTILGAPLLAGLPRVVIAGILAVTAVQLVDPWSVRLLGGVVARKFPHWRTAAVDVLVVALVATVTVTLDLVVAVAVGVAIAIAVFLLRMSRTVVRRTYRGNLVHSKRTRHPNLMAFLAAEGGKIVVFELEGPIFFATAEHLARRVEAAAREGSVHVILDLRRVNEIDSTGARMLIQIHETLRRLGARLLLSHATGPARVAGVLRGGGVITALGPDASFTDTDAALERAEELLIQAAAGASELDAEIPVAELPVLAGLTDAERQEITALLERRRFKPGDILIREGDHDRTLFMMARGTASVTIDLPGEGRVKRLATFASGTVFGEVALLDKSPRSATVVADDDVVCYVLSEAAFDALTAGHPAIAIHLLTNLGRELSLRLRKATAMISQLES